MATTDSVLFIGDVHIKFKNLEDVDVLEKKVLEQKNTNLSFIVLAGDVLDTHERVHTQLLNRAYKLVEACASVAHTYVLVGNHDYINNSQMLTDAHWMNGMKKWPGVTVVDKPVVVAGRFVCVPYCPPGRLAEALDSQDGFDWRRDAVAVFAHQEVKGAKMGAIVSAVGDVWDISWPVLISGHIHDRQNVGSNVIYPGSSLNHAFGNDNQGVFVFDFDTEKTHTPSEKYISLGLEKKKLVYVDVEDAHLVIKKLPKHDATHPKVTVCVTGNTTDLNIFKKSKTLHELSSKARVRFVPTDRRQRQQQPDDTAGARGRFFDDPTPRRSLFWETVERKVVESGNMSLQKDFTRIKAECQPT
jgi:DNA repair exonuclease SbcCD nuclease subunit